MAGLYVPLDVDFATDPKFLAAGPVAGYLYICSLALVKRTMSDGVIETEQLSVLAVGLPGQPQKHVDRLVAAGLWEPVPKGWRIVSWLKRNPSRKDVEAKRERKRVHAVKANHDRWHKDGKTSPECPRCDPSGIGTPIQSGLQVEEESETEPEAVAEPGIDQAAVDAETARRIDRRRLRGEDIGPKLEALIRQDVIRDAALAPTALPNLPDLFARHLRIACSNPDCREGWDCAQQEPCPACRTPQTAGVFA